MYFGANGDAGNTDETVKFPCAVALVWRWTGDTSSATRCTTFTVRNMKYVFKHLDTDHDGWPKARATSSAPAWARRSSTTPSTRSAACTTSPTWRQQARHGHAAVGDAPGRPPASRASRRPWWNGEGTRQYADSLADPGNTQVFQRHWIGVTPAEAEIRRNGTVGPLASLTHARELLARREERCYTGTFGLFHTGSGHTSPTDDTEGPACDSAVSTVPARETFTLNSAIMAAAEAQLGRMAADQLGRYTTGNARLQLDPSVWELPGAMPEIAPSPDFVANIDQRFTERSQALQAWGTYGVLWPVVHYQLGVAPDVGRGRIAVVPQVPPGQHRVAGQDIRVGTGSVAVTATSTAHRLQTVVRQDRRWHLTIGAVLPAGARVAAVRLDGRRHAFRVTHTSRGAEVVLDGGAQRGRTTLVIVLR